MELILIQLLANFCENLNISMQSADDLLVQELSCDSPNIEKVQWLKAYIALWDASNI